MKKLLCVLVFVIMVLGTLVACEGGMIPNPDNNGNNGNSAPKEDVITVEDGYLVVNGVKTEHKVHTDPIISVIDGYVAVNGVKTEYKVDSDDVIEVVDGYLVVNGVKTEYKVDTPDVIEIIDGYVVVNGVKTDIYVPTCNHSWTTVTTAPTCTAGGYDTLTCSLCGKSITQNETAKLDHIYSTSYSFDDTHHWYGCTGCDAEKDKSTHTPDDDGICTVCQTPISATPGVIYDVSADGTYAEVIGYEGTATKVKIASEYQGLPVKNIYDEAFKYNTTITSVIIPDGVTNIGRLAFYECSNLGSVAIPSSMTSIDYAAFSGCISLIEVIIPDNVTTISNYAFDRCSSLNSVIIGDSVTTIGDSAFFYCTSLESVKIPNSVTRIEQCAFEHCSNLKWLEISDNISYMGSSVFSYCHPSLYTEYEYGKYVRSADNPYAMLINVTNLNMSSYVIHKDTKMIFDNVFSSCSRLRVIYYSGSEAEWTMIKIGSSNTPLTIATIHYNYVPEE